MRIKSCLFLLAMMPAMIGCGNPHEAGVATGDEGPPEVETEEFSKGEEAQQNQAEE